MAKNHSRSTAKKQQLEVSLKKQVEEVALTSKKQVEDPSTSKKKKQPPPESHIDSSSEEEDEYEDSGNNPQSPVTATVIPSVESETDTENDDSDSESESAPPPPPAPVASLAATTEKQISDTESDSDEETDSDSKTEKKDPVKTNHVSSVVKNQDKTSKKSKSKRSRETDGAASTDVKRVKRVSGEEENKSGGDGEEKKKTLFQRLWTEEDEITVLKGNISFKNETGLNPSDNTNEFYLLVKNSISFTVSKVQVMDKLRTLKKKFEKSLGKAKYGEEPVFSKAHDRKVFDLSKKIWGVLESAVKLNKTRKSQKVLVSSSVLVKLLVSVGVDELAAQQGLSKLSSEDKKICEEQGKALQLIELDFHSQRSGVIHQLLTKIAEASR